MLAYSRYINYKNEEVYYAIKRESLKDITINTTIGVEKIYPKVSFSNKQKEHKTIDVVLSKEQAIKLATDLLIGAKEWDSINLTGFRAKVPYVTVTIHQPINDED